MTAHVSCFANSVVPDHGAQWLSGRVLDSRPKGRGFEPHWRHCVVVLEPDTFILAKYWFNPEPRKTRPYITERLLIGRKESNQTKKVPDHPDSQKPADLDPHCFSFHMSIQV